MARIITKTKIESTYKDKDVEEFIDIHFFRPFGYVLALAARFLRLTPNTVTILSMLSGVISGHLFYYSSMTINIIGIFVKIFSNALDSADGQLARMTNSKTDYGRILDGISGHVIFLSIYIHLCLRYVSEGGPGWIIAVATAAGICHIVQAGWGDYYRNGYLYFVRGARSSELEPSNILFHQYKNLKWEDRFLKKIVKFSEYSYVLFLESFTKKFQKLKSMTNDVYGEEIPTWLGQEYRKTNKSMNKYYNILTINVRQFTLFALLLVKIPEMFFVFELTVLNGLFLYAALRQENNTKHLISQINVNVEDESIQEKVSN